MRQLMTKLTPAEKKQLAKILRKTETELSSMTNRDIRKLIMEFHSDKTAELAPEIREFYDQVSRILTKLI